MSAPTVTEVREALKNAITGQIGELNGYDTVPDVTQLPAIVVQPDNCDYLIGGGDCQEWAYLIYVLVPRTEVRVNQEKLDAYLSVKGAVSVIAALKADDTLGLDGCDCTVLRMDGYGGMPENAGVPCIGARVHVKVVVTE